MIKTILLGYALFFVTTFNSIALQVGNTAPRLDVAKWLKNGPASIIMTSAQNAAIKPCRAIEFWGTWNPNLRNDILTLNYLQQRYHKNGLQIIAISREPAQQIANTLKRFTIHYVVGADRGSHTTLQYMGDDQIFPKIFLLNQKREIIWKGEIADFAAILKKYFQGNLDIEQQIAIGKMHDQLRLALRSFNSTTAEKIIKKILTIDPDDGFSVRAAMFIYEKSRRPKIACEFIDKRITAVPTNITYRLIKLQLLQQYFAENITAINRFSQQTAKAFSNQPEALNELAWFLLNNFPFTPDIILTAFKVAKRAAEQIKTSNDTVQINIINTTLARAYCIVGNPERALKLQTKVSLTVTDPQDKKASLKYEKYYRQLVKLRQRQQL